MRVCIHMIIIDTLELNFFFDQDNRPTITIDSQTYTSIPSLLKDYPHLADARYKEKMAQVTNFLLKGLEFHYIENIEAFKEDYEQRIENEQSSLDDSNFHPRLSEYGVYNLSSMHNPSLENGKLTFFVKNDYTHLPYKVSLPFPSFEEPFKASYELLPYI